MISNVYLFNYNGEFEHLVKQVKWYNNSPFGGLKVVPWGLYNVYEGWHENGDRMYYYNYNEQLFAEWEDNGDILTNNEPVKTERTRF